MGLVVSGLPVTPNRSLPECLAGPLPGMPEPYLRPLVSPDRPLRSVRFAYHYYRQLQALRRMLRIEHGASLTILYRLEYSQKLRTLLLP